MIDIDAMIKKECPHKVYICGYLDNAMILLIQKSIVKQSLN